MWGVYVTSYARIHLHSILKGLEDNGHIPLYCDTDSAFFIHKGGELPYKLSKELGDLSEDGKFVKADFINPKGYILEEEDGHRKIASKGVPSHLGPEFLLKGEVSFKRPTKMREALASKKGLVANFWNDVTKVQKTIYIKRKHTSTGFTKPLLATEIPWAELKLENFLKK
jgi:hypothetical protein